VCVCDITRRDGSNEVEEASVHFGFYRHVRRRYLGNPVITRVIDHDEQPRTYRDIYVPMNGEQGQATSSPN